MVHLITLGGFGPLLSPPLMTLYDTLSTTTRRIVGIYSGTTPEHRCTICRAFFRQNETVVICEGDEDGSHINCQFPIVSPGARYPFPSLPITRKAPQSALSGLQQAFQARPAICLG